MNGPTLLCGDCLELMSRIPDGSIDMVLSDLPYGTTRCRWDTPINLQELWKQYRRVVKENGAIVLFSAQPFTTELISSNKAMYRYEWIWKKTQPSGFMNAKKMPLRIHENIEIFYRKPPTYNPQMTHGHQRKTATAYGTRESDGSSCYGREERNYTYDSTDRYPVDVLQYSTGDKAKRLHPTQKPVDLLEYLVKTYTNPGETVLDNCMGAGSTGVACMNTGREFAGWIQNITRLQKKGLSSMSQGSNRISNSIEMNAAVVELLEDVMKENDGKEGKENVIFSQKAKTLVKEIADFSRNTRIYREAEARREEFRNETKDATPALIYGYLLDRVVNAPTMLHASGSVILLIPRLDELLNGTEEA